MPIHLGPYLCHRGLLWWPGLGASHYCKKTDKRKRWKKLYEVFVLKECQRESPSSRHKKKKGLTLAVEDQPVYLRVLQHQGPRQTAPVHKKWAASQRNPCVKQTSYEGDTQTSFVSFIRWYKVEKGFLEKMNEKIFLLMQFCQWNENARTTKSTTDNNKPSESDDVHLYLSNTIKLNK